MIMLFIFTLLLGFCIGCTFMIFYLVKPAHKGWQIAIDGWKHCIHELVEAEKKINELEKEKLKSPYTHV